MRLAEKVIGKLSEEKPTVIKEKKINNFILRMAKSRGLYVVVVKTEDGDYLSNKSFRTESEANLAYNEKLRAMKAEATRVSLSNKE